MDIGQQSEGRLSLSLEQLNARIARLAMSLGVHLDEPNAMDKLLERPALPPGIQERRRRNLESQAAGGPVTVCPERRVAHLHEELRGLVVLRYQLEAQSVATRGLEKTHELLSEGEDHLARQGFKPGADGVSLHDFEKDA
jgi:hypothetical protein